LSKEEIDPGFPVSDINNDGSLSYKEFATIMQADNTAYSKMPMYRSSHSMQLVMETTSIKSKTASLPSLDRPKTSPVKVYRNIAVKCSPLGLYHKIEKALL
jgi:hypothetical protein